MKNKKIVIYSFYSIVVVALFATAILELIRFAPLVEVMVEAGYQDLIDLTAIIKLTSVALFLIPRTRNIGFLLMVAYIGGIISFEWAFSGFPISGVPLMILLWIGMYLENPQFFFPSKPTEK